MRPASQPGVPGARAGAPFLVTLGGQHLLTYGVVTGLVADPAEVTIVQIDAHADLADELGGGAAGGCPLVGAGRWSHRTVMRRLWERGCRLVQIGIRSLSRDEHELMRTGRHVIMVGGSRLFWLHDLTRRWAELLHLAGLPGRSGLLVVRRGWA